MIELKINKMNKERELEIGNRICFIINLLNLSTQRANKDFILSKS